MGRVCVPVGCSRWATSRDLVASTTRLGRTRVNARVLNAINDHFYNVSLEKSGRNAGASHRDGIADRRRVLVSTTTRLQMVACRCSSSSPSSAVEHGERATVDRVEDAAVKGLLLSFLASQNRSFFASKCFVEVVQEMYKRGYSLDSLKRMVTFGTLSSGSMEEPLMCDIMLTWLTCVFVTLEEIGLSKYDATEATDADIATEDSMVAGLRDIAKIWIQQFNENDMTLSGLLLQQSMNDISEESGPGEFIKVMQQNARLVLLTLQVVRDSGDVTALPLLHQKESNGVDGRHDTNFRLTGFIRGMFEMPEDPLDHEHGRIISCRAAAVRLLLSFNGAALGYLVSAKSFVDTAAYCYVSGWTADDIYSSLLPEEFEQSGGLVKVARPHGGTNVSATLFARWLSIVYMTMAKLGVAHPKASECQGWAWVCSLGGTVDDDDQDSTFSGSLEAHGVHDFVCHTLSQSDPSLERTTMAPVDDTIDPDAPPADDDYVGGFSFKFEDPDLIQHSGFALVVMQQISLVTMTRNLIEPRLPKE